MWTKALLASLAGVLLIFYDGAKKVPSASSVTEINKSENDAPRFWFNRTKGAEHAFESMEKLFLKLGWKPAATNDVSSMDTIHYDWDFLWTIGYFDDIPLNYSKLEFYQKINHIPGCYLLTSKSVLSTQTVSKYVPRGFMNKTLLQEFAAENPGVRFVQKNKGNRGVSLKTVDQMDFKEGAGYLREYFAQVFVEDPLLLDGHKFDFNIYVVITSINPLRVYYYKNLVSLRVCRLPYNPGNFSELDSYVISDSHISGYDFPPIKKYFDKGFGSKDAFEKYLIDKGHDSSKIYHQVEDAIQTIVSSKESKMIHHLNLFNAKYGKLHFVELFRFDFLIDAKLNLHLMEVNLSPNLHASHRYRRNRLVYESVIYNYLNLIGVGSYTQKRHIRNVEPDEKEFLYHDSSISVLAGFCLNECDGSCDKHPDCQLCTFCMSANLKYDFRLAYLEQMNRGDFTRVIPPSYDFLCNASDSYWNQLTPMNKLFAQWSLEMCKKNQHFC